MVGVNDFVEDDRVLLPILTIDPSIETQQVARLMALREEREKDATGRERHAAALAQLNEGAMSDRNLLPLIVEAVRQRATVGELVRTMKGTFGEHREHGY